MLKKEWLSEKFIKKWFRIYFFSFLIAPTWYIVRVVISNSISVSEVWILYSIIWFISLLSIYNDLWMTNSLAYFLPKFRIEKKYNKFKTSIALSLSIQLISSLIIWTFLFIFSNWFAEHYFQSPQSVVLLKRFTIYFLWINIFQVIKKIFSCFQDTFSENFVNFIRMFFLVLLTIGIFFIQKKYWIRSSSQLTNFYWMAWIFSIRLALIISLLIFIKKYHKVIKKWKIKIEQDFLKEYFNYAIWIFVSSNIWILLWQTDQQMILLFLGPKQAWYYTNYLSLVGSISIIIWPILWFLFPVFRESLSRKDWKVKIILKFFYKYLTIWSILMWLFYVTFWPEISSVLFWTKFILSGKLFLYSWRFIVLNILNWLNFSVLPAMWLVKENTKIIFIARILNVILNIILLNLMWILWAVIATIIGRIFIRIKSFNLLNKKLSLTEKVWINSKTSKSNTFFERKYFFKNIITFSIIYIILFLIKKHIFILDDSFRYQNFIKLIIISLIIAIIFILLNRKEIKLLKNEIFKVLKFNK